MSEDWRTSLQRFIEARLRVMPYRVARQRGISIPSLPLNVQFIIDGVLLAIEDHPDRQRDSADAIIDHLRHCYKRLSQLCTDLEAALPSGSAASKKLWTEFPVQVHYCVSAALMDVYLAWCLVDAALKQHKSLSATVQAVLPIHVATLMPVFTRTTSSHPVIAVALREYRPLFFDLMASWSVSDGWISQDCLHRCEAYLRHKFLTERSRRSNDSTPHLPNIAKIMGLLNPLKGEANSSHATIKVVGREELENASRALFFDARFVKAKLSGLSCSQCGATFAAKDALEVHFRNHLLVKGLTGNPSMRLRFASINDFIHHRPTELSEKATAKNFVTVLEAFAQPTAGSSGSHHDPTHHNKRSRAMEGIVVQLEKGTLYRCGRCQESITPVMDSITGEWVLRDCVQSIVNGQTETFHTKCQR